MDYVKAALRGAKQALSLFEVGKRVGAAVVAVCIAGILATTALIAELIGLDGDDDEAKQEDEPP